VRALEGLSGPDLVYDVILPALAAGERIQGFRFQGYWEDVGELGTYYRANRELLATRPLLRLDDPRWPVLTRNEERPPARFGERSRATNSLVAGGARVDGTVTNSVVFPGAWIEDGAVVEDSIVFHDAWIGRSSMIRHAILDKDAIVGEGARIGGPSADESMLSVLGKEAVVLAGETVPPGTMVPVGGGRGRSLPPSEAAVAARGEWPR